MGPKDAACPHGVEFVILDIIKVLCADCQHGTTGTFIVRRDLGDAERTDREILVVQSLMAFQFFIAPEFFDLSHACLAAVQWEFI